MSIPPPRDPDHGPRYDPACTPCVLGLDHDHPGGRPPIWMCLHCHNRQCAYCDPAGQFCSCDCGLKETP